MASILNKSVLIFTGFIMLMFSLSACKTTQSETATSLTGTYYACCNLKVLKGKYITWVNWQAAPTYIPVNTELRVNKSGASALLTDVKSGKEYALDIGSEQDVYINKFISEVPIDLSNIPEEISENIIRGVARIGMTKEQVYYAMGPPTWIPDEKTYETSYEEIMTAGLWIYARRKLGKKIGVRFNPVNGEVSDTEGIWK